MSVSHCRVFYECRFVLSGLIESAVTVCNAYNAGAVSDGGARNRDLFSIFTVRMRDFTHLSTSYPPKRCIAMKVALFQQDIVWCSPWENMRRAETALAGALGRGEGDSSSSGNRRADDLSGSVVPAPQTSVPQMSASQTLSKVVSGDAGSVDLIVLPEMFTTGFCVDPSHTADVIDDGTAAVVWMRRMSVRYDAAVTGSVAVADGERYFNRMYFVRPDGGVEHYDKRHLFAIGGEADHYTAGCRRVVVAWRGVRILLQVCYDLRFPVFARSRGDYDMIVYAANWPTPRIAVWDTLLMARAIENQCYVAGVNRAGRDPWCDYCGRTVLIDPYGRVAASCGEGEHVVTGDIDMDRLAAFRRKFPVLDDRDAWQADELWRG